MVESNIVCTRSYTHKSSRSEGAGIDVDLITEVTNHEGDVEQQKQKDDKTPIMDDNYSEDVDLLDLGKSKDDIHIGGIDNEKKTPDLLESPENPFLSKDNPFSPENFSPKNLKIKNPLLEQENCTSLLINSGNGGGDILTLDENNCMISNVPPPSIESIEIIDTPNPIVEPKPIISETSITIQNAHPSSSSTSIRKISNDNNYTIKTQQQQQHEEMKENIINNQQENNSFVEEENGSPNGININNSTWASLYGTTLDYTSYTGGLLGRATNNTIDLLGTGANKIVSTIKSLPYNSFQIGQEYQIMERGAVMRESEDLESKKIMHLPAGVIVIIEKLNGRRAMIRSGNAIGWVSVISANGKQILVSLEDLENERKEKEQILNSQKKDDTNANTDMSSGADIIGEKIKSIVEVSDTISKNNHEDNRLLKKEVNNTDPCRLETFLKESNDRDDEHDEKDDKENQNQNIEREIDIHSTTDEQIDLLPNKSFHSNKDLLSSSSNEGGHSSSSSSISKPINNDINTQSQKQSITSMTQSMSIMVDAEEYTKMTKQNVLLEQERNLMLKENNSLRQQLEYSQKESKRVFELETKLSELRGRSLSIEEEIDVVRRNEHSISSSIKDIKNNIQKDDEENSNSNKYSISKNESNSCLDQKSCNINKIEFKSIETQTDGKYLYTEIVEHKITSEVDTININSLSDPHIDIKSNTLKEQTQMILKQDENNFGDDIILNNTPEKNKIFLSSSPSSSLGSEDINEERKKIKDLHDSISLQCESLQDELIILSASLKSKDSEINILKNELKKILEEKGVGEVVNLIKRQKDREVEECLLNNEDSFLVNDINNTNIIIQKDKDHEYCSQQQIERVNSSASSSSSTNFIHKNKSEEIISSTSSPNTDFLYLNRIQELEETIKKMEESRNQQSISERLITQYFSDAVGCGFMASMVNNSVQNLVETVLRENARLSNEIRNRRQNYIEDD